MTEQQITMIRACLLAHPREKFGLLADILIQEPEFQNTPRDKIFIALTRYAFGLA